MARMPLTGTIGANSSLKQHEGDNIVPHRRSLPEPVVSFHLPTVRRSIPQIDKSNKRGKSINTKEEQSAKTEENSEEDELGIESSLILLQSLRQSRLVHLTALLPYLSTRHRTATRYNPTPSGHPFPGGLDPSTTSHSLIHMGRADVRTGPLLFPRTRFGEVRVEGGVQDAKGSSLLKQAAGKSMGKKEGTPVSNLKQTESASTLSPPAQPPIDEAVVKAVSNAAQKDPKLQALLHTAANGKASPDELRELAKFISIVSESFKGKQEDKKTSAASTSTSSTPRPVPAPTLKSASYPPIVTVEYRENPSARFILPLWRGCAVERISNGGERTIKVTMLLPAIGSAAATRAEGLDSKGKAVDNSIKEASKISPMNPPSLEQLTAPAPKGAETHAVTWLLSGDGEDPLPDGIWHIFGRVSGAKTIIDGVMSQLEDEIIQQFVEKLQKSIVELPLTPPMRLEQRSVPRDLSDHLTDKYAPRMQTLLSKPIVKFKRGEGGGEEEEEVEVVRDQGKRGWSSTIVTTLGSLEKRKRMSTGGQVVDGEESFMTTNDESSIHFNKPKRKRHVAKFNSDGSLKLCQACGTNSTPIWRRGPAGKSTLCNACGAKWKVGRLIVSGDLPSTNKVATTKSVEVQSSSAEAASPISSKQVESATISTEETS